MELLSKSGIEFDPKEILHNEKTTGWIGNYCVRICKFFRWIFKDMDSLLSTKSLSELMHKIEIRK